MDVSEYTDKVDIYAYHSKTQTMVKQLKDLCAIMTGEN